MRELRFFAATWGLALLAAGLGGGALGRYGWNIVAFALLYTLLATSWSWMRATGLFSLGQAAFFGTGALAEGWLSTTAQLPPLLAVPLAAVAGALAALPLIPALRLSPPSFALATLAYAVLLKSLASNVPALGPQGFLLPATPAFSGSAPLVLVALAVLAVGHGLFYGFFLTQPGGRAAAAVRQAPDTAQACGIGLIGSRWLPLTANAGATAIAGAIYAHLVGSVEPVIVFSPSFSVLPLVLGMVGGALHPLGGLLGTLALYPIDEFVFRPALPQAHALLYGLALVALLMLRPAGLLNARIPAVPAGLRRASKRAFAISAEHLALRRGGVPVLRDITLEVPPGKVLRVVGPNGAGKSSLLLALAGGLPLSQGVVRLDGRIAPRGAAGRARQGVVHTFQAPQPFKEWTVGENVAIAAERAGVPGEVDAILDALHLTGLQHRRAGQLSVGEGKRLELARALALRPAVLLLDEPLAGLAPSAAAGVASVIGRVRDSGTAIVWAEHGSRAGLPPDQLLLLEEGRVGRSVPA